jgi:hypothetical protein
MSEGSQPPPPAQRKVIFSWEDKEPPREARDYGDFCKYLTPVIKKPLPLTMPDMSLPPLLSDAGYPVPGGLPPPSMK